MSSSGLANTLAPYSKEIIAFAVPLIGALVNRWLQPRAKLFHSFRHAFTYLIQEPIRDADGKTITPSQVVHVSSLAVSNTGRSPAKAVEIVFNWKPQYFNVWPLRHYTPRQHEDDRFSIVLDSLAPGEIFGVSLLAVNNALPDLCNVRSEQTESIKKVMQPQVVQPKWILSLALFLMFSGLAASIYFLLVLIEWAVK